MRILYVANSEVWGGGEQAVLMAARLMAGRGHEVGLAGNGQSPLAQRFGDLQGGVAFYHVALGPKLGRHSILEFLRNVRRYRDELLDLVARRSIRRWDVIHFQYKKEQLAGTAALAASGFPVAWTEHGGLPQGLVALLPARAWYRRAAGAAAGIAPVSRYVASSLAAAGVIHERTRIIYNAVDERAYILQPTARAQRRAEVFAELHWPATSTVVGSICRLAPRKGVDHLLKAAFNTMPLNEAMRVLIVGDGSERAALEAMVPDSLRSRVAFVGFRGDVPRYLAATDVLASPTVDPTEGFPLRVVEAMMAGVPVVATRVAGQPEAITDGRTGMLVSPNDLSGLSAAIGWVVGHDVERKEMALRARQEAVERFGIDTFAREHEAFLRECWESTVEGKRCD